MKYGVYCNWFHNNDKLIGCISKEKGDIRCTDCKPKPKKCGVKKHGKTYRVCESCRKEQEKRKPTKRMRYLA